MNIFRFIGDHDSLINVLVLLLKIYITKSWSGVSLKTQELYAMVLLARYLDLCGGHRAISHGIGQKVLEPHLGSIVGESEIEGRLLKESEILGSIRVGVHWTPIIVSTKALRRCPEGVPLDTIFIHPSVIDMLDSAAEDAIKHRHLRGEAVTCVRGGHDTWRDLIRWKVKMRLAGPVVERHVAGNCAGEFVRVSPKF
ncbi:hypothetical protein Sjap_022048 [Stephania japonica]|uniref:Uncharacterized protein n=1 Tax=Stephania japonica TaxID=461633 RepID=A0AAP0ENK7_9MAGN